MLRLKITREVQLLKLIKPKEGEKVKKASCFVFVVLFLFVTINFTFPYVALATKNVVEYGNDKNYAPFSYVENGNIKGFETDLINLIFSNDDFNLYFNMDYTWAQVLDLTKSGKLDMCGPLIITPQHKKDLLLSDVAYSRYYGVFSSVQSGELKFNTLGNYKIGAVRGYHGEVIANDIIKAKDIVLFDNYTDMLHALAENRITAVVDAIESVKYYIRIEGLGDQLILQKDGLVSYNTNFGISKDRPELLKYVNKRLKDLIASGEYEILYIKNFSTHSKYYSDAKNRNYIFTITGIITTVLLMMIFIRLYVIYLRKRILSDNEKLLEKDRELLYLSRYDRLTGLYDRRFFEEEIIKINTKENLPLSIIIGDVNGLKLVNDSFGHEVGDKILVTVASVFKKGCRKDDVIARLGGDEFVIALPKSNLNESNEVVNSIKNLLKVEKVNGLEISVSFGCDVKTDEKQDLKDIFKKTEDQMYRRKIYESASTRSKTINLITSALFEKSSRELIHSKKVSELCVVLSERMGFSKESIDQMRLAGLMHDIGKIGISDKILNKNGKLSEDEYLEIKKHPEIGYRILSAVNEFSEIAQFILYHHEKWDGTGYPQGLKGEEIKIESRIIAIVDAYDAMTSKRTYGTTLSHNVAMNEIRRCAGTQFDPVIAEIFIALAM